MIINKYTNHKFCYDLYVIIYIKCLISVIEIITLPSLFTSSYKKIENNINKSLKTNLISD